METNLIKGKSYLVKDSNGTQSVRRIFKYTEKRFDEITCYVFTSKVSKDVKCEVEETKTGVMFFRYSGARKYPAQEISIPFYNLKSITEA